MSPGTPNEYVRIVVFRDLDDGENVERIKQSFHSIADDLLSYHAEKAPEWESVSDNIFKIDLSPSSEKPGLRLILHIANPPLDLPLKNKTTDGYILASALMDPVIRRFSGEASAEPKALKEKVLREIPEMMNSNGITFDEDKDFLGAYLCAFRFWTMKRTEEKQRFVKIVLDRAIKYDKDTFWDIFDSWKVAIEEATR